MTIVIEYYDKAFFNLTFWDFNLASCCCPIFIFSILVLIEIHLWKSSSRKVFSSITLILACVTGPLVEQNAFGLRALTGRDFDLGHSDPYYLSSIKGAFTYFEIETSCERASYWTNKINGQMYCRSESHWILQRQKSEINYQEKIVNDSFFVARGIDSFYIKL